MKNKILLLILLLLGVNGSLFAQEKQFDKYGGWKGLKGSAIGVFHTEKINDRWWIITPEGNVFWSTGMYCVRISGIPETGTDKRAYRENCLKKYGSEKEWARVSRKRLYEWGFNTIGDWSSVSIYREPGLVYVVGIDLPKKTVNVIPEGNWGYFPDVFSQEFRDSIKEAMAKKFKVQPYLIDDPWLLGYFLADEPSWYGSKVRRGSLVDDFISLDSPRAGKKAWVDFVKTRYQDINDLNKTWRTNFQSFDELFSVNKIKDNEITIKDKLVFLKIIAEQFSKVLHNTLREFDQHHMILGTRPTRSYPEVVEGIGKYSDVFSIGAYNLNQGYTIDLKLSEFINEVYKYSGKPILLGVLIAAQDTGLPYGIVKTQKDRGISYWRYLAEVTNHPVVVGMHWYQYFDPPKNCFDGKAANWGVVNQADEPYAEAVELIAKANKMVYAYAAGLTDFAPDFNMMVSTKKEQVPESTHDLIDKVEIPIPNANFEQGKTNWTLQAWKGKSKASIDSRQKYAGRNSLKIQGGPDEGWGSVGVGVQYKPKFTLKPGYKYRLSAWIKTQDVENSGFVRIKVKYASGSEGYFGTQGVYGIRDWKLVETKFSPKEENTVEYLDAQLVGKGTAWFDDIKLEVIE